MEQTIRRPRRIHAHHWLIDEVVGPTSKGSCVECGATRTFRNWPAEEVLQKAEYAS